MMNLLTQMSLIIYGKEANKMETIFKFSNIGENLGTRILGETTFKYDI